jgi:hypothetical protein
VRRAARWVTCGTAWGSGGVAHAHTMAMTPYDLPIPFWLYVYTCAATLLLTFGVLAFLPSEPARWQPTADRPISLGRVLPVAGQTGAVALLGLTVAAGLWGTPSPIANIAPTMFWVGLMLGLTIVTAALGDVFQIVNPWYTVLCLLRVGHRFRLRYPQGLAYWPAFICYLALSWLELMAPPRPSLLAWALLAYSGLTVAGAVLFGREAWFRHAELFSVFFRLIGTLSPVGYVRRDGSWLIRLRPVLSGTLEDPPRHISLLLFLLFMLAGTTYDGVFQTSYWTGLYWHTLMVLLHPIWGDDTARAQALLAPGYVVYQRGGLIAAPFVYLVVYMTAMLAMRILTGRQMRVCVLALRFAYCLIPIALSYMVAHAWTELLTVIPVLPFQLTDPFGVGWNMLGIQRLSADPGPLDMGQAWHVEVTLILIGHVTSVYLAHQIARQVFPGHRQVWLSELPLLVLMVGYTFIGLTVLSLPLVLH